MPNPSTLGALPAFKDPPAGEEPTAPKAPAETILDQDQTPADPDWEEWSPPSTTDRPPPQQAAPPGPSRTSSTPASTEVAEAVGALAASASQVLGIALNKLAQKKRGPATVLWLMTEKEAKSIGDPLGRIAARKAPEELVGKDAGDVIELAAGTLAYASHNVMGIPAKDFAGAGGVVVDAESSVAEAPPPAATTEAPRVQIDGVEPPSGVGFGG